MTPSPVSDVLRIVLSVLIAGNLAAFLLGVLMLAAPQRAASWLRRGEHGISLRQLTKPLYVMHDVDGTIMRYPRVLAALLLAGALSILVQVTPLVARVGASEGGRALERFFAPVVTLSPSAWETLWLGTVVLMYAGAVLAALVGLGAWLRAETLSRWAQRANRWASVRQMTRPVSKPFYGLDRLASERPRLFGGLIAVLAAYSLAVMLWLVRGV